MTINELFQQIETSNTLQDVYPEIDTLIQDTQDDTLIDLLDLLIRGWDEAIYGHIKNPNFTRYSDKFSWRYSSMITRILDYLVTSGHKTTLDKVFGCVETIVTMPYHGKNPAKLTEYAIKLIVAQPLSVLEALLNEYHQNASNFCAILFHELIIHGADMTSSTVNSVADHLVKIAHPLHRLPLELLPHERLIPNCRRSYFGMTWRAERVASRDWIQYQTLSDLPTDAELIPDNDHSFDDAIKSVFKNWEDHSNGRVEIKHYHTSRPITANEITATTLLLTTDAESLNEIRPDQVEITCITSEQLLAPLFGSVANGASYSFGLGNAYGRLTVWESIAGFLRLDLHTPIADLHDHLDKIVWFQFRATSAWFEQVALDTGIIAFDDSKQAMTILAATDID